MWILAIFLLHLLQHKYLVYSLNYQIIFHSSCTHYGCVIVQCKEEERNIKKKDRERKREQEEPSKKVGDKIVIKGENSIRSANKKTIHPTSDRTLHIRELSTPMVWTWKLLCPRECSISPNYKVLHCEPVYSPAGTPDQSSQSWACRSGPGRPAGLGSDGICGFSGGPSAAAASPAAGTRAHRYLDQGYRFQLYFRMVAHIINLIKRRCVSNRLNNCSI